MNLDDQPAPSLWSLFADDPGPAPRACLAAPSVWDRFAGGELEVIGAPRSEVARGRQLLPCCTYFHEELIYWAMRNLPVTEAVKHFLICGVSGSGKTTAIKLFLQSIAPRFQARRERPEQLILFDYKGDAIPMLASLGLYPEDENVWILNPGDERGARWNLGEAAQSPALARRLATLLVPEEKHSNAPFFADGARSLVYAAILALNKISGPRWTFRDLLCALDSPEHIEALTSRHPPAQRVARPLLQDRRHSSGVLSTLATKVGQFDQVAALWHSSLSDRTFSIPEFLKKPGVLVLSNDAVLKESFWPINALLLKALTQEILREEDTLQPRHWFVLDEFPAMKNVDCIPDLVAAGRSKGASVLLGIQGIEGVSEIYRHDLTNAILSQCAYKTFLRAGGPVTAEWAERFFGKLRRVEPAYTQSWSKEGQSSSVQYSLQDRSLFNASYFENLPFPSLGGWYESVSDVPWLQSTLISRRSFDQILALSPPRVAVPGSLPREHINDQTLWPWTEEEEVFFCGEIKPKAADDDADPDDDEDDEDEPPKRKPKPKAKPTAKTTTPGGITARRRKRRT